MLKPVDKRGKRIRVGDRVRIAGMPDLTGFQSGAAQRLAERVFLHLQGQCKTVAGFDQHGCAEIHFHIRKGRDAGWHGIAIEPYLLLVQQKNTHPDS